MKRCGFRAFDGERIWTCLLPKGHEGECYAARWKVERAFWEGWDEPGPEPEPEYEVTTPPAFVYHSEARKPRKPRQRPKYGIGGVVAGVQRKREYQDNVYASFNDYVTTAVSWEGREVTPLPTLDQIELSWRTTL